MNPNQTSSSKPYRLVVAITGASGVILGIRLLEISRHLEIETHLILSPAARLTINQETQWKPDEVLALANFNYSYRDIGASLASGSFNTKGMVVIPCSIKTLSAIANSYADDLIVRAADVTLKEGRPLLLVVREAPLHRGHLRLMTLAAEAGAIIFPPVPAFYARPGSLRPAVQPGGLIPPERNTADVKPAVQPDSLDDLLDNIVGRVLARLGIDNQSYSEWSGLHK
jgi:4-hydroxy-3-polyprenylbenzoate decarboxylase